MFQTVFYFSSSSSSSSSSRTSPLILNITLELLAFELIVTAFIKIPTLLVSYSTSISPDSPGWIGLSGLFGTVHPHEDEILLKTNGALPVFVNLNVLFPSESNSISP